MTLLERISIFWSGSASFETFLRGDFLRGPICYQSYDSDFRRRPHSEIREFAEVRNAMYPYHDVFDIKEAVVSTSMVLILMMISTNKINSK